MKIKKDCDPTIIHRNELLSNDNEYMDKETIKKKCLCKNKSTCLSLLEALQRKDINMVNNLIDVLKSNK